MTTIVQPTKQQQTSSYRCVLEYEGERVSTSLVARSANSTTATWVERYLQKQIARRLMDQGLFLLVGFLECGLIHASIRWYPERPL